MVEVEASHEVVACKTDPFLGARLFDEAFFDHFASAIEAKHGEGVKAGTRRGLRLLTAVERLRKLLSTLPAAAATAENLLDGIDVPLKVCARVLVNARCQPGLLCACASLLGARVHVCTCISVLERIPSRRMLVHPRARRRVRSSSSCARSRCSG